MHDPRSKSAYPRDLIGYGANPPQAAWPNGARIAVQIVMNYEEGSEYSIPDGDDASEMYLTEVPGATVGPGKRDLIVESVYEYGSRAGFWRLMRMFADNALPIVDGLHLTGDNAADRLIARAWSAALEVTGMDGVPAVLASKRQGSALHP